MNVTISKCNDILNIYLVPITAIIGSLLNLTCLIIFFKIIKRDQRDRSNSNSRMFQYLLLKAFCDFLTQFPLVIMPLYFCDNFLVSKSYVMQMVYILFYWYWPDSLSTSSGLFEIAATFDCAISIRNRIKWTKQRCVFNGIVWFCFFFPFIFHIFLFFKFSIVKSAGVYPDKIEYLINGTYFSSLTISDVFDVSESLIRDVFVLIVLLIINIFVLIELKRVRKRKIQLHKKENTTTENTQGSVSLAEMRKIKMIFVLCIIYFVFHTPYLVYTIHPILKSFKLKFWSQWLAVSSFTFNTSYLFYFFIYFFFNLQFRKIFLSKFYFLNFFNGRNYRNSQSIVAVDVGVNQQSQLEMSTLE
jgi:hypothetical protein